MSLAVGTILVSRQEGIGVTPSPFEAICRGDEGIMRIGIVGTDNSHALGFSRLINLDDRFGRDVRVTVISGSDRREARAIAEETGIRDVVGSPEEMVSEVDAGIIVDRDGGLHLVHAEPFISSKVPVLIDKPLATTVADADAILQRARQEHSLLTSYSSVRWCEGTRSLQSELGDFGIVPYAEVSGPCDLASPYGGHFFYGIHLAEIALTLFPGPVRRVRVVRGPGVAIVVLHRDESPMLALNLLDPNSDGGNARFPFHVTVLGTRRHAARDIQTEPDLYHALTQFFTMLNSGKEPLSSEEMLEPIRVLEAVSYSLEADGAEVTVPRTRTHA